MKKLTIMLVLMVAVAFAAAPAISNDMLVETVIHHTPTGFVPLDSGSGAGYYFWDSDESGDFAPVYSWIDATGGTLISDNMDDAGVEIAIPMDLRFMDVDYATGSSIWACSNGYINFNASGGDYTDLSNDDIPNVTTPNNYIAPYWDDLDGDPGVSGLYSLVDSSGDDDLYIISYDPWGHFNDTGDTMQFQAYMVENNTGVTINNTIVFQYANDCVEGGSGATVGLENFAADDGTKYSYNDSTIAANLAIIFIDAAYVDNYIGAFDLVAPADASEARDGDQVTFDWDDASYSGTGTLTYDLILSNNADLSAPFHTEADLAASTFDYTFSQGNTSDETVYWGVEANETTLGLNVASDSIWSITLHASDYAVEETTWGQIKTL